MKLAGEFEFLGDAYEGDPEFDAPLPKGVVKLYYPGGDVPGDMAEGAVRLRCGFFRCPWWRWGAFKEAATRRQPDRAAKGIYPIATIVLITDHAEAEAASNRKAGRR